MQQKDKQYWQTLGPANQKKDTIQINRIRNEQRNMTDTKEIKNIVSTLQTYTSIGLKNLKEMNTFQETFKPPKLYHEGTNNLNRPIKKKELKTAITCMGLRNPFLAIFCQTSKRSLINTS